VVLANLGPGGLVKVTGFGMAKLASFGVVTTADHRELRDFVRKV